MTIQELLEQYHDNEIFSDDQLGEIQSKIIPQVINFILDKVEEGVKAEDTPDYEDRVYGKEELVTKKSVSTIINQLRMK